MNAQTSQVDVLVVGAGPTGLLLAAELTRRGVSCRVIDANPEPLHWDRATIVHSRSLEVFESLGIVEGLLAAGVKQRAARLHSDGGVLGEIDLSLCGSRYGFNIGVSEEETESILTDYLHKLGSDIVRSSRLQGLAQHAGGVVATIEHSGKIETVAARWVVGCDGVRSTTRSLCGIELTGSDHTEHWAVFDATLRPWTDSYEVIYAYLDQPPVIFTALPHERWRVYLRPTSSDSDLIADALTTVTRYLPSLGFVDVEHPTRFHCHSKVAARYRADRILLAGDAAHVCSPSQGHGMNSGLQDAFNLAWKLALVCQGHATSDLLDSYEAERRPVAEMIAASGEAVEKSQNLRDSTDRRARDATLRAIFADPVSRHHESIAEAELDIDYGASPIVLGDKNESLAPGQRIPDTIQIAQPNGESCLLHTLTHRAGHTALLLSGESADAAELSRVASALHSAMVGTFVESAIVLSTCSAPAKDNAVLSPTAANQLGITGVTLLVIRPDGHVGLRADRNHLPSLAAYARRLTTGRA